VKRRRADALHEIELRLGKPSSSWSASGVRFHYVYILQSEANSEHFYTGLTDDLKERLCKHNAGEVPHTAKFKPWRIKTAIAFGERERAAAFERYLKSGSGRAFARKHF
jgi:putative endonuclease